MEQIEDEDIIEDSFEDPDGAMDMMFVAGNDETRKKSPPPQSRTGSSPKQSTSSSLVGRRVDRLCEFAECLMHCLLFKINYYDKKAHFDKCLKYDVVVYVSSQASIKTISNLSSYLFGVSHRDHSILDKLSFICFFFL